MFYEMSSSNMSSTFDFGKWASNPSPGEEVVITGVSGRFPESNNFHDFQENLFNKVDMVTDDDRRWKLDHPEIPQRNGKIYNIDKLDAGYFGVHYRQADIMDPLMRKFLECAIEAIIDAGINPSELEGSKTAVLVGACYTDLESETLMNITQPQRFGIIGYLRSFLAHRISYFLKLKGPSCILDTACSSSMNALELAFKYIRTGKCDNAIVGGVNLVMHPGITRQFFRLGVLSPDGTCKVFDEKANGYVRSETSACIFLQKAKDAKRIYAQIMYTKVNGDGFKPAGITYPSTQMQQELMTDILQDSGVDANDISFMEAHGTGTQVGDPQEVEAIDNAIAKKRTKLLLTGSVKCSVGHTEPSSGLCSLAKVIITMETGYIPPNIHLKTIKKGMPGFQEGRMKVVTEITKLDRDDAIIGVNNFGFGGNNCHVLLRRFKKTKTNQGLPKDDIPRLVCVSGRTEKAILALLGNININYQSLDNEYVGLLHQIFKKDVKGHIYRGFTIVSTTAGPIKTDLRQVSTRKSLRVIFGKFETGHKVLGPYLIKFSCFRAVIKRINEIIIKEVNVSKGDVKFPVEVNHDSLGSFAVQIGIVDILKLLEIEPEAVYGDSISKLVTAYYYNNISLEDAVCRVYDIIEKPKDSNFAATVEELAKDSQKINYDLRSDGFLSKDLIKISNSLILNISDNIVDNSLLLVNNKDSRFLEVLGRLYEEGHNPQIHKLYPIVQFPVSRSTPMISPFIHWDYGKSWKTFKFGEFAGKNVTQEEHNISAILYEEQRFLTGHIIDERNLVPATEYLEIVRKTLVQSLKMTEIDNLPIVFENCKFIKAVTVPKTGVTKLLVSIQKNSGNFEVVEKDSAVVSGRIFIPEDIRKYEHDLPTYNIHEEKTEFLEQDEIYRELYLRGYNYTGLFKGIVKCNVDVTAALIKWEKNLTTFLDTMLQMKILQMNTRSLYVPVGIKRLTYNPIKHAKFTETQSGSLCPIYNNKETNVIKSGGIEICGLQATAILKKKSRSTPVLEKHVFVPNSIEIALEDSVRVITHIILENSLESNFKAVEILDESEESSQLLSPLIAKVLDNVPCVLVNLTVSTKQTLEIPPGINVENFVLTPTSNLLLIVATNVFQNQSLLNQSLSALSPNGFLLSRESIDFVSDKLQNIEILTEHSIGNEKIIVFQKTKYSLNSEIVEMMPNNFDWLPQIQKILKQNVDVIIYSQYAEQEGILGFVNCIRREPKGCKVKCFFMIDAAPKFEVNDPFYQTQISKHMAVNIYKNGKWGTYRHLLLKDVQEVEGKHFFLKNMVKGDLSSLKWVEGSLTPETKVNDESILIFPFYSSLNFKDIMIASGRVSVDTFTLDRIEQECCQGFEFCGRDIKGRRLMGMANNAAMATMVPADKNFLWEIPDYWSCEDASTAVVVYATVVYGLLKVVQLKPGTSVLIHSATGGIGLAAINVCLYHDCDIYVTVGTQEKREYLRQNFPQIPENHIGNSRDTSFVEMIKTGTNGRGVDIVLNSLSEEKLKATVACVASEGNLLEIGKFDLGNDTSLGLLLLERNINYHGIMLDRLFAKSPEMKIWIVDKIYEGIAQGYVKPLPRTVFKRDEVGQAYKFMTTGKHIGKVVIQIRDENNEIVEPQKELFTGLPRFTCKPNSTYIIVGGLGGFGLELADWLYLRGAKKLVLVSRLGIQSGYQKQRIKIWRSCDVKIQISTADVTTKEGCLELINEANRLGPVDGIFNLAVVLKDALFEDQTEESFNISLAPKAQATAHLDRITRESCPNLRYFVVFSSVSCGRGNAGQTNYGMANSIMERICERRKNDGFPGLAIQWGAIGEVGLVAKMQKENKELVIGGTLQQKVSSCLEVLDRFLKQDNPIVASMVVAERSNRNSGSESAVDFVAYILGIRNIKTVSPHTSFAELGLDSMMGTEMIQTLEKDFEIYVTAIEVRNMTFAKLMELETQLKAGENKTSKTEMETDILLRYIPSGDLSNTAIIKLSSQIKEDENAKAVFVFPGVEGAFEDMELLIKNLKAVVLGIKYNYHNSSIEEYAASIIPLIEETISKENSFHIISYSFGTVVATEVVSLLEAKGFTGVLISIDGSPAYVSKAARERFPSDNENEFQTLLIFKILSLLLPTNYLIKQKDKYLKCKNLEERLELAKSHASSEVVKKEDLQKQTVFALYNRFKSVVNYKFEHAKIKSPVHLFKARVPMVSDFAEDYQLSEICEQKVQVTVLDADHATILHQHQLVEDINRLLTL